jgi:hypothetical protein
MTGPQDGEGKAKEAGDAAEQLGGIGRALAGALHDQAPLAYTCLLMVIAGLVTIPVAIALRSVVVFLGFLVCILVVAVLGILLYRGQRDQARRNTVNLEPTENPMQIAMKLSESKKRVILGALAGAAESVAESLNVPHEHVRANIFALDQDGRLRIVPGLIHNMDRLEELSISMQAGEGSTGRAFASKKPNYAIFRQGWGENVIEGEELAKVHPELQWIISVPIFGEGNEPVWVFNVDGLRERREPDQLRSVIGELVKWVGTVTVIAAKQEGKKE